MRRVFVTGIGTEVGKTVVSSIIVEALQADYWKPVQTGSAETRDTHEVKKLVSNTRSRFHDEAYCLNLPASPHHAAEVENQRISLSSINLPVSENTMVIEGAGGVLVPLNEKDLIVDLITKFEAEAVLVVKNYLGSINHTLLSVEALRSRGIKLTGIVFTGAPNKYSEDVILNITGSRMLGRILQEPQVNREMVSRYALQFRDL